MEDWFVPHHAGDLPPAQRVLVLAPHPDDETFGCGGAIARYCDRGARVRVMVLTDGAGYEAAAQRLAIETTRRAETQAALASLGVVELEFVGLQDRMLATLQDLHRPIAQHIVDFDPQVVLAPSPWEVHPDHRAASRAIGAALADGPASVSERRPLVLFYEVGALQRPNLLVDITAVWSRKAQAMQAFGSQQQRQDYARHISGLNAYRAYTLPREVLYAEAFRVVEPSSLAPEPWPAEVGLPPEEGAAAACWAREALAAAESAAEKAQHHLAERERAWACREHELALSEARLREEVEALRQSLELELRATQDALQRSQESLAERQQALQALAADLTVSRQETQGLTLAHEAARVRIAQLEGDVEALLGSTSWRVTAPLRWLSRRFTGPR